MSVDITGLFYFIKSSDYEYQCREELLLSLLLLVVVVSLVLVLLCIDRNSGICLSSAFISANLIVVIVTAIRHMLDIHSDQ